MTDAKNRPVVPRTRGEVHSADQKIEQRADVDLGAEELDREQIVIASDHINDSQIEALAFMEEPVSIMLHSNGEKNAPIVVDCWVNGRGAEVFMNGQWIILGYLPIGKEVITKRKYVDVLARTKIDNVSTEVVQEVDSERNLVKTATSHKAPFSIIEDRNPKGREWLSRIMREQA